MWPDPTPENFDLNEFDSKLPKVAFTKITAFLGK